MPLIRYDIGDIAEFGEPCDSGFNWPVLNQVNGRIRDSITLPDGGSLDVTIPSGIEEGQDVVVTVWRKGKECALTAKKHAAKSQESKGSEAAPDAAPSPLQKRSEGR